MCLELGNPEIVQLVNIWSLEVVIAACQDGSLLHHFLFQVSLSWKMSMNLVVTYNIAQVVSEVNVGEIDSCKVPGHHFPTSSNNIVQWKLYNSKTRTYDGMIRSLSTYISTPHVCLSSGTKPVDCRRSWYRAWRLTKMMRLDPLLILVANLHAR